MEPPVLTAALMLLVVWSTVLTVLMLRRRPERWEPVYQRLPDGRIRFAWSVAHSYESTRRERARPDAVAAESAGVNAPSR